MYVPGIVDIGYSIWDMGYEIWNSTAYANPEHCGCPEQFSLNTNAYVRERKETLGRTITFDTCIKIEK